MQYSEEMQALIDTCNKLCNRLDKMADEEKKFGFDICFSLQQVSNRASLVGRELQELRDIMFGGVL